MPWVVQGKVGRMTFPNDGQQATHQVYQGRVDFSGGKIWAGHWEAGSEVFL